MREHELMQYEMDCLAELIELVTPIKQFGREERQLLQSWVAEQGLTNLGMELNSSDVLIMGQVTGDASWLQSSCSVEDNVDLVRRAVRGARARLGLPDLPPADFEPFLSDRVSP